MRFLELTPFKYYNGQWIKSDAIIAINIDKIVSIMKDEASGGSFVACDGETLGASTTQRFYESYGEIKKKLESLK